MLCAKTVVGSWLPVMIPGSYCCVEKGHCGFVCLQTINTSTLITSVLPSPSCPLPTSAASVTVMQQLPINGTEEWGVMRSPAVYVNCVSVNISFHNHAGNGQPTPWHCCKRVKIVVPPMPSHIAMQTSRHRYVGDHHCTHHPPVITSPPSSQAAGDANLRDLTNSKTSAPRAPSGEPEVMQRGTPSTNAAAQAQPSTLAILSLHPTEEGAATTTKSHSAVRGNNNASSIPVQSPIVAGNSTDALPPAAPHAAHMSMASQFAQQARPPVQPDFSTADNYGVQHNAAALPQMSDSVVQPELSLVQPPTRRGGADVSTVGGSHAASRGGSAVLGGHGMVGPTESVCSKHPRGAARPALSEKVGEATGGRVGAEGGGGHGGGQVGGRGSACRTTRGARGVMVADADDVVSIGMVMLM